MVRPADVEALKQLALLGAMEDAVELASTEFAELLEVSQQTGSRRLIELTEGELVSREMGVRKQRIRITDEGRDLLRAEYMVYQRLFESPDHLNITGTVETGLGEGRYYLSRPGYESQFEDALGWIPFSGTLNLGLGGAQANKLRFLKRHPIYVIEGFEAEGRTFGGVTCHPARIGEHECAVILPNRSHYTQTLEVIAPVNLRELLGCSDGDAINTTIQLKTDGPEP